MGEGKRQGTIMGGLFFLPPHAWHVVAALPLVAAPGVFVCFCRARDCEGLMHLGVFRCPSLTCVKSSHYWSVSRGRSGALHKKL